MFSNRTIGSRLLIQGWVLGASIAVATQVLATEVAPAYGKRALSFEANLGQSDGRVKFLARGRGYTIFLTAGETVLRLNAADRSLDRAPDRAAIVRMRLAGSNKRAHVTGLDPQAGKSNYFIGNDRSRWRRHVPNYSRVRYAEVYPGIDLVYHGSEQQLEYDFVIAPGANPKQIAMAFAGVRTVSLDPDGSLILGTEHGPIVQRKPVIYQTIRGSRQLVDGRYVLLGKHRVGFHLSTYDTTQPLTIDPVLAYATYLGGSGNDVAHAIAVDSSGNAYITGQTNSPNFPVSNGSSNAGSYDAFVTKFDAAGGSLVFSTYLGGSAGDYGHGIAVDAAGNVYVTGETDSPTSGPGTSPFPTQAPVQGVYNGGPGDAFICKIGPQGDILVYSTYLGGSGAEIGYAIAADSQGSAYVTGNTTSFDANGTISFPTAAPYQALTGGGSDAFVTKLSDVGALVYSTYLGGTSSEASLDGGGIAVDADGNAYVAGSTGGTFPGTSSSLLQSGYGGGVSDGFVVKFNAAGSALIYSTYLGGATYDAVNGIAIDSARNVYITGYTDSTNFPTASPLQAARAGGNDAFVAKIDTTGGALVYSTYLGGSASDKAFAIAVDGASNAHVCGTTSSTNFPVVNAFQPAAGGSIDAFVTKVNASGSALLYSSYLGGSDGSELGYGIALDTLADAYVVGSTASAARFPLVAEFQAAYGGSGTDAFLVKVVDRSTAAAVPANVVAAVTAAGTVMITWNASAGATRYQVIRRNGLATYKTVASTTNLNYDDFSALPNTAYLYSVRAIDATGSPTSNSAYHLATTVLFDDAPLVANSTIVKAVHITQLRTAVNAIRGLNGIGSYIFTDPSLGTIRKVHIDELRTQLNAARVAISLSSITFPETLIVGVTTIKAAHVTELRNGVK